MDYVIPVGEVRSPVSTYALLPLTDNILGDVRIVTDTGVAYSWKNLNSSGSLVDWQNIAQPNYANIKGTPNSTPLAIDNAVQSIKAISLNLTLLAFNLTNSIYKLIDGIVDRFGDQSGMNLAACLNAMYFSVENPLFSYYEPNFGGLDIYTKLLCHCDGNNNSTTLANVIPGFMSALTCNGNAKLSTSQKKFGTASLYLDGVNSYVEQDYGIDLAWVDGQDFTFDMWIYPTASGKMAIVGTDDGTHNDENTPIAYNDAIVIEKDASNKLHAKLNVVTGYGEDGNPNAYDYLDVTGTTTINSNEWTHIAVIRASGYLLTFVNGNLEGTSSNCLSGPLSTIYCYLNANLTFGPSGTWFIGLSNPNNVGASYFTGYIDEIRYSKDIARWLETFTPPMTYYNQPTGVVPTPTIADLVGHEIDAHEYAIMTGQNAIFGNASLYLDGNSYISSPASADWKLSSGSIGGNDANTSLLLHLDNDILDSSLNAKAITNNGIVFSNTVSKFGGYSGLFNGTGSLVTEPSPDFNLADGDFTIDGWFRFSSLSDAMTLFCLTDGSKIVRLQYFNSLTALIPEIYDGTHDIYPSSPYDIMALSVGVWYHIALVRNENVCKLFVNGNQIGADLDVTSLSFPSGNYYVKIGVDNSGEYFAGNIDEFRVSTNIARWTSNFLPPSSPYSVPGATNYTLDLWVSPIALSNPTAYIMGVLDSWNLTFDGAANNYLKFSVVGVGSLIAPVSLSIDSWTHIAVVQYNGVLSLYVNGILASSITGGSTESSALPLTIGADSNGDNGFYGYISEVRISNIARWVTDFLIPENPYILDGNTTLLLPFNYVTLPAMTLVSNAFAATTTPSSARIVIFEEDVDTTVANIDIQAFVSRDGGTTFTQVLLAKQNIGENIFTGSVDLTGQPSGSLMVYKIVTAENKDLRIYSVALSWK